MPLPISHGLVGASVVALNQPQNPILCSWQSLLLSALLAISPDFDFFLVWGLQLGRGLHRGFTHSLIFAGVVTALMLMILGISRIREAIIYGSAYLSHALLDFSTTKFGGGVELLWPFSTQRFKLELIGLSEFPIGFKLSEIIKYSVIELMIFVPLLLIILLFRKFVILD
ncbi:MAG: metal-dependent hydrolase [Pyrinomonadaceae bacterium]